MSDFDIFSDIAAQSKVLEEAGNTRDYKTYINTLLEQNSNGDSVVTETVNPPSPSLNGQYVCIKEPLEFLKLFDKHSNSKEECSSLFANLIGERNTSVVDQVIQVDDPGRSMWFNTTSKGINLRPGLQNNETSKPTVVQFGKPDDNVHAIVVGATGSGKSVFLHNLLFSMMAEYAPWELNLFLVDFKKVSLSKYLSKYETPHVKAVAATSEVRYVVSLLEYLNDCMRARQTFFAYLGLEKLEELREKYQIVLPRVVLLVDEFQQMFTEATPREERTISEILTSITKLGRATGFHLIFASQEMNGTLSANAFANFKVRFALRCNADVSSNFLGNPAASTIGDRERGIVYENSVDGKAENNRRYKVPYIKEDGNYFYEFLENQVMMAEKLSYHSVHKYYQEDFISDYQNLVSLLNNEKVFARKQEYLKEYSNIVDILTLGDAVVFNYKRVDCETIFLEYGSKKNIGIFSPRLKDVIYTCKLLATNLCLSPNSNDYDHWVLMRNDLFERNFDLGSQIKIAEKHLFHTDDKFELYFLDEVSYRKDVISLLQSYEEGDDISEFVRKALSTFAQYYLPDGLSRSFENGEEIDGIPTIDELCSPFENVEINSIPEVISKLNELHGVIHGKLFEIPQFLYQVYCEGKDIKDLFKLTFAWIIGTEMMDSIPFGKSSRLIDEAPNYKMIFIFVGTSDSKNFDLFDSCDYLFLAGNHERIYDRWGIPFTNKNEESKVIDFKVRSAGIVRSFKKYFSSEDITDLPRLDFDELLFGTTDS